MQLYSFSPSVFLLTQKSTSLVRGRLSLSINLKFYFCGVHAASFVFPLTCAAEKHIISEKPLNKRFFKGTGVVLAGIECSPKIFDFRASGIPVQERVDFFDTLKSADKLPDFYIQRACIAFLNMV